MTDRFTVFQSDESDTPARVSLRRLGFFGRLLDGTALVALSLAIAITVFTTGARASALDAATTDASPLLLFALGAVFAVMLMAVRHTWMQASRSIARAPRRDRHPG